MQVTAEIDEDVDNFLKQLDAEHVVREVAREAKEYALELYDDLGTDIFSESDKGVPGWKVTTHKIGRYGYEFIFRTDHLVWRVLDFGRDYFRSDGDWFIPTIQTATTPHSFWTQRPVRRGFMFIKPGRPYGYIPGRGFSLMIGQKVQKRFRPLGLQVSIKLGGPIM